MTVAVSCNLSEGVILGVDSAVSVMGSGGVLKVYENAQKLFQLGDRPVGVAIYGLAQLGERGVGSYIREFEETNPGGVLNKSTTVADIVEAVRSFFWSAYQTIVIPILERESGKKFADLDQAVVPSLGLVVGGFSHKAYLSEIWNVILPLHAQKGSAQVVRKQGSFGTNWFATFEPIRRYIKGYDPAALNDVFRQIAVLRGGQSLTPAEEQQFVAVLSKHEYQIPFGAMPLEEGVAHVRFLVDLVIGHHRFVTGAPIVGGQARLGKVTYRVETFQLL